MLVFGQNFDGGVPDGSGIGATAPNIAELVRQFVVPTIYEDNAAEPDGTPRHEVEIAGACHTVLIERRNALRDALSGLSREDRDSAIARLIDEGNIIPAGKPILPWQRLHLRILLDDKGALGWPASAPLVNRLIPLVGDLLGPGGENEGARFYLRTLMRHAPTAELALCWLERAVCAALTSCIEHLDYRCEYIEQTEEGTVSYLQERIFDTVLTKSTKQALFARPAVIERSKKYLTALLGKCSARTFIREARECEAISHVAAPDFQTLVLEKLKSFHRRYGAGAITLSDDTWKNHLVAFAGLRVLAANSNFTGVASGLYSKAIDDAALSMMRLVVTSTEAHQAINPAECENVLHAVRILSGIARSVSSDGRFLDVKGWRAVIDDFNGAFGETLWTDPYLSAANILLCEELGLRDRSRSCVGRILTAYERYQYPNETLFSEEDTVIEDTLWPSDISMVGFDLAILMTVAFSGSSEATSMLGDDPLDLKVPVSGSGPSAAALKARPHAISARIRNGEFLAAAKLIHGLEDALVDRRNWDLPDSVSNETSLADMESARRLRRLLAKGSPRSFRAEETVDNQVPRQTFRILWKLASEQNYLLVHVPYLRSHDGMVFTSHMLHRYLAERAQLSAMKDARSEMFGVIHQSSRLKVDLAFGRSTDVQACLMEQVHEPVLVNGAVPVSQLHRALDLTFATHTDVSNVAGHGSVFVAKRTLHARMNGRFSAIPVTRDSWATRTMLFEDRLSSIAANLNQVTNPNAHLPNHPAASDQVLSFLEIARELTDEADRLIPAATQQILFENAFLFSPRMLVGILFEVMGDRESCLRFMGAYWKSIQSFRAAIRDSDQPDLLPNELMGFLTHAVKLGSVHSAISLSEYGNILWQSALKARLSRTDSNLVVNETKRLLGLTLALQSWARREAKDDLWKARFEEGVAVADDIGRLRKGSVPTNPEELTALFGFDVHRY